MRAGKLCVGTGLNLSGSMGKLAQIDDPEVQDAIDTVLAKTRPTPVFAGASAGFDPAMLPRWIAKGVQWINLGNDFNSMYFYSKQILDAARQAEAAAKLAKLAS